MANYIDTFNEEVRSWLHHDRRLERLSADARAEVESEVLTTVFLRTTSRGRPFNRCYVCALLKYQLRPKSTSDPYVRKARRRAEERQKWGLRTGESSLAMTRQSPAPEPIESLIEQEQVETEVRQFRQVEDELQKLNPRARAVMAKYLRGETPQSRGAVRLVQISPSLEGTFSSTL